MPRRLLVLLASAALLPACANHVRFSRDRFETTAREVVHAETVIQPGTPVLASPGVELEILADETTVVRRLRTRVRIDEHTPYSSGHEFWEVPAGIVSLPVLLVVRVLDLVGFGFIPDAGLDEFSGFTFAAMNPLLNVESDSRLRRTEVSRETEELDRAVSRELRPLAGIEALLALDAHAPLPQRSDARGRLPVDLLALAPDTLSGRPRALHVTIEADDKRARRAVELPLSHALGARVVQAMEARQSARAPGATPETVGRSLARIDTLGFSASALALESELRARQASNPAWLARLESALRP